MKTRDIVYIGIFAALITICSWISIPMTVPFTLQTFAVFLAVLLLGGRRGVISVLIYILLGIVGVPVFSGFRGGPGVLLGPTGGYILGFVATALIMWAFEKIKTEHKTLIPVISMLLGLLACYAFGTAWFSVIYNNGTDTPASVPMILGWCVIPFIIPDLIKILLAFLISRNPALRKVLS
ncbi:MAG: biotin transporter BioY [Lachnospiraceae bacterium]|nr:biotin transporter BioY [Lachnospiraceae bacterium]